MEVLHIRLCVVSAVGSPVILASLSLQTLGIHSEAYWTCYYLPVAWDMCDHSWLWSWSALVDPFRTPRRTQRSLQKSVHQVFGWLIGCPLQLESNNWCLSEKDPWVSIGVSLAYWTSCWTTCAWRSLCLLPWPSWEYCSAKKEFLPVQSPLSATIYPVVWPKLVC